MLATIFAGADGGLSVVAAGSAAVRPIPMVRYGGRFVRVLTILQPTVPCTYPGHQIAQIPTDARSVQLQRAMVMAIPPTTPLTIGVVRWTTKAGVPVEICC